MVPLEAIRIEELEDEGGVCICVCVCVCMCVCVCTMYVHVKVCKLSSPSCVCVPSHPCLHSLEEWLANHNSKEVICSVRRHSNGEEGVDGSHPEINK